MRKSNPRMAFVRHRTRAPKYREHEVSMAALLGNAYGTLRFEVRMHMYACTYVCM